jgi:Na+/H+ antiporter NhaD/arsenite permease-like protein
MEFHEDGVLPDEGGLVRKAFYLLAIGAAFGFLTFITGGTAPQVISVTVFIIIVIGTLFFWTFRLAIAFLGVATLLIANVLDIPGFIAAASLPVILFLVGMMIVVGALRDLGFFTWIIQLIMGIKGITGMKFVVITALVSAVLASLVDEVTSIIFMAVLIFQVCDTLKIRPTPYLIISVLATNIGSSGTMLGNPVGIFIGTKAGLTFEDFIVWAFPVMLVSLAVTIVVTVINYRKEIKHFEENLQMRKQKELGLGPVIDVNPWKGLVVLIGTVGLIAVHYRLERALGLQPNTILLMAPLISAGIIMIVRRNRARHYVEAEVDWWTLTFFLLLFAVAGTLEHTGLTSRLAGGFGKVFHGSLPLMITAVAVVSAVGSAFVDNVIFVAAFVPVVKSLGLSGYHAEPLWWALLFGACYGGNITMIGSTANIVALGMLEKRYHVQIKFMEWLKVGILAGGASTVVATIVVIALAPLMPHRPVPIEPGEMPVLSAPAEPGVAGPQVTSDAATAQPSVVLPAHLASTDSAL